MREERTVDRTKAALVFAFYAAASAVIVWQRATIARGIADRMWRICPRWLYAEHEEETFMARYTKLFSVYILILGLCFVVVALAAFLDSVFLGQPS